MRCCRKSAATDFRRCYLSFEINKESNEMMNTTSSQLSQAQGNPFAVQASTGGGALAAITGNAAVTNVLASIWIAKQFPRDLAEVTARMNQSCSRLTLAQSATYAYPRGGTTVEGPSIRLAEALIGAWGNAEAGWKEVGRHWDAQGADGNGCHVSECVAFCFDKETNVRREIAFSVPHTRDRNETDAKGKRTGKMLRVALESERDVYELCANMASRRIRACILQVLPGWLTEEALEAVGKTLENGDKRPLKDMLRSMEAKFKEFGVTKEQLERNLGHGLEETTKPEMVRLGKVFNSIAEGMVRVRDVFPVVDDGSGGVKEPKVPVNNPAVPMSSVSSSMEDGIPGLDMPEAGPMFGSVMDD